jgi:hypothetical protein
VYNTINCVGRDSMTVSENMKKNICANKMKKYHYLETY